MGNNAITPHFPNPVGITSHSCLIHQKKIVQHIPKVIVSYIYFKTSNNIPYRLGVYGTIQQNSCSEQGHSKRCSQSQEGDTEHLAAVSTVRNTQEIGLTCDAALGCNN